MSSCATAAPSAKRNSFFIGSDGRVRPLWRALLFFLGAFLLTALLEIVVLQLTTGWPLTLRFGISRGLGSAVVILLSALFLLALDRRSFRTLGLWFYVGWGGETLHGIVLGAGLLLLVTLVTLGSRAAAIGNWAATMRGLPEVLGTGVMLVVAAALEELILRGYLLQRLRDSLGGPAAVTLTSLLFAAGHVFNPSSTRLAVVNTVLAGILLALAYLKTRALWLPIGLHWAWNFTMGPILGMPISGIVFGASVFKVQLAGPGWLSGGAYGPEGGAVLTVVTLAAIVWLARTKKIRPSPAMEEVLK